MWIIEENFTNIVDISLFITLFTFICYYFGKLISEVKIAREEKSAIYIAGFFFVTVYILIPFSIIYSQYKTQINILWIPIILIIQFFCTKYLYGRWCGIRVRDLGLKKFSTKETDKRLQKIINNRMIKKLPLVGENIRNSALSAVEKNLYSPIKWWRAFIVCTITIFGSYVVIKEEVAPIFILLSLLMSLQILSFIAMLRNCEEPVQCTVYLEDEKTLSGQLKKIETDYVTILDDRYSYNINKDKIRMIKREAYNMDKIRANLKR